MQLLRAPLQHGRYGALSLFRSCDQHWQGPWTRRFTVPPHTIPRLMEYANIFIFPSRQHDRLRSRTVTGWISCLGWYLGCVRLLRRIWMLRLLSWFSGSRSAFQGSFWRRVLLLCLSLFSWPSPRSAPVHYCFLRSDMPTELATAHFVFVRLPVISITPVWRTISGVRGWC